jgi:uncharacterized SAM-binding protein YcdF (DUF218 family)
MIRLGKRLRKIAIISFVLLLLLAAILYFWPQPFLCVDSGPAKADVIIVLGGGDDVHERVIRAAEFYNLHAAPRVLVTGFGDAAMNRRILIRLGVPATNILVESKSKTTRENAEFSAKILQAQNLHSAIIVTSWYHSRRALKTFEHYGPNFQFYSRPSYFLYRRARWTRNFFRHVYWEYVKLPGYWVAYGVCPF